ncbi:elongation of very long chain fatty acids protein 2 [Esox lucius]|uniref:Elongation of very long chain fatty acids protein 2 n=1 Tax=Esox lucius TaxID=8010 RepID=A0AAY5JVU7_ESOLU|nr:elongation of very long chain fatty acids protein 2 [Esox lucius]
MDYIESLDNRLNTFVDYLFGERDTRVRGWLLLDSCLPTLSLTILYLLAVYLGTKYMRNRTAYSLKGILQVYNLGVTMLSLYMLVELICATWSAGYRLQCQGLYEAGEGDIRVAKVLWWYYFSKLIEFLDTIFFVLRKKNNQITFLHVYHHASMFNIWWCVMNWIPCGQSFFGPTLNCFIHVCMYSYYGLSTVPSMHKYLWWKRYLTQAQLVQFILTITHTLSAVVVPCGFPFGCLLFQSSYMMTLVIFFVNFYIQTYRKRQPREVRKLAFDQRDSKSSHQNGHSVSTNGTSFKKSQ